MYSSERKSVETAAVGCSTEQLAFLSLNQQSRTTEDGRAAFIYSRKKYLMIQLELLQISQLIVIVIL